MKKGHSSLKGYTFKEFQEVLAQEGFFPHHKNSTHMIFANEQGYYVTVPCNGKKEVNHRMSTVSLQRIRNSQCRRMSVQEYKNLKQF